MAQELGGSYIFGDNLNHNQYKKRQIVNLRTLGKAFEDRLSNAIYLQNQIKQLLTYHNTQNDNQYQQLMKNMPIIFGTEQRHKGMVNNKLISFKLIKPKLIDRMGMKKKINKYNRYFELILEGG